MNLLQVVAIDMVATRVHRNETVMEEEKGQSPNTRPSSIGIAATAKEVPTLNTRPLVRNTIAITLGAAVVLKRVINS
ncbi:hypothetical protein BP6252_11639 [Coleophoma cylindrospora]|uniref:Uncharacterized protein n=1 Tax=Coleophoma cylindrospora TaxID=1849047 RepID=A0A3D8QK54_9HELO|nr:hypothetical protein BP6252_11639 [Coleophoma cylindrospora]